MASIRDRLSRALASARAHARTRYEPVDDPDYLPEPPGFDADDDTFADTTTFEATINAPSVTIASPDSIAVTNDPDATNTASSSDTFSKHLGAARDAKR